MNTLEFLYGTAAGRILLRPLISKPVSALSGRLLDTKASKVLIGPFAKSAGINRDDYILDDINSFNDFFCRRIKEGRRSFDMSEDALTSPCDGMLSAYKINDGLVVGVKQSRFDMAHLLRDRTLAIISPGIMVFSRSGTERISVTAIFWVMPISLTKLLISVRIFFVSSRRLTAGRLNNSLFRAQAPLKVPPMPTISASLMVIKSAEAPMVASASPCISMHSCIVGRMPLTYFLAKPREPMGRLVLYCICLSR